MEEVSVDNWRPRPVPHPIPLTPGQLDFSRDVIDGVRAQQDHYGFLTLKVDEEDMPTDEQIGIEVLLNGRADSKVNYNGKPVRLTVWEQNVIPYCVDVFKDTAKDVRPTENLSTIFARQAEEFHFMNPPQEELSEEAALLWVAEAYEKMADRFAAVEDGGSVRTHYLVIKDKFRFPQELETLKTDMDHLRYDPLLLQFGPMNGITSSWTYVGSSGSNFGGHLEDQKAASSASLMIGGSGWKGWLVVAPRFIESLFKHVIQYVYENRLVSTEGLGHGESNPFAHKSLFIHPRILRAWKIPYHFAVQRRSILVSTSSLGYHQGFNFGNFSIAKAVNYVSLDYLLNFPRSPLSYQCQCNEHDAFSAGLSEEMAKKLLKLFLDRIKGFEQLLNEADLGIVHPSIRNWIITFNHVLGSYWPGLKAVEIIAARKTAEERRLSMFRDMTNGKNGNEIVEIIRNVIRKTPRISNKNIPPEMLSALQPAYTSALAKAVLAIRNTIDLEMAVEIFIAHDAHLAVSILLEKMVEPELAVITLNEENEDNAAKDTLVRHLYCYFRSSVLSGRWSNAFAFWNITPCTTQADLFNTFVRPANERLNQVFVKMVVLLGDQGEYEKLLANPPSKTILCQVARDKTVGACHKARALVNGLLVASPDIEESEYESYYSAGKDFPRVVTGTQIRPTANGRPRLDDARSTKPLPVGNHKPDAKRGPRYCKCGQIFSTVAKLRRHIRDKNTAPSDRTHICSACNKTFSRPELYREHVSAVHRKIRLECKYCNEKTGLYKSSLAAHYKKCSKNPANEGSDTVNQ